MELQNSAKRDRDASRHPHVLLALVTGHPQSDESNYTYYTVPARNAPVMVTINRRGEGKVWNFAKALRIVSTFKIEPASAKPSNLRANYTYTAVSSPNGDRAMIIDPDFARFRVVRLSPFKQLWRSGEIRAQPAQSMWSEDGRKLVVPNVEFPRASWVFDANTGRKRGRIPIADPLVAGKGRVYGISGTLYHGGITGFDLLSSRAVVKVDDPSAEGPLGLSPDGRYLIAGGHDQKGTSFRYRIWRTSDGRKVGEFPGVGRSGNHPLDPIFLDAQRFALLGLGEIHSLPTGRLIRRFPPVEIVATTGVQFLDPKNPLRPRHINPKPY